MEKVSVKLNYNPYIKVTQVKFNEKEPRINSLVEKYKGEYLQTWIEDMPQIFYDEMNGFGFDIEFYGPELELVEIRKVFEALSLDSEDEVDVKLINGMENRQAKEEKILHMLQFLEDSNCKYFDYEEFKGKQAELLDSDYSFIVYNDKKRMFSHSYREDISVAEINDLKNELNRTDLTNIPILFCIIENEVERFERDFKEFLGLDNVKKLSNISTQFFFYIDETLPKEKIERIIFDLGVETPQIIASMEDERIKRYMDFFPISTYIYDIIRTFNGTITEIEEKLKGENERLAEKNKIIYDKIGDCDKKLDKLTLQYEKMKDPDNIYLPVECKRAATKLIDEITTWRAKKIRMNSDAEAQRTTLEYEVFIKEKLNIFLDSVQKTVKGKIEEKAKYYYEDYNYIGYDNSFKVPVDYFPTFRIPLNPNLRTEWLKTRKEIVTEKNADAFLGGILGKKAEEKEQVTLISYEYRDWRKIAIDSIESSVWDILDKYELEMQKTLNDISSKYVAKLESDIQVVRKEKEEASAKLSDEEKQNQQDNEWLVELKHQLSEIEEKHADERK